MKRRTFIQVSAAAAAGTIAAPYILKSEPKVDFIPNDKLLGDDDGNIMIIVEMFGGNDGLNTILPLEYEDEYMKLRPTLNIPKSVALQYGTSDLYFNPALATNVHNDGFLRLFDEGRVAIVNGIGYDNPNQSHFRSRDIWHSGINTSDPGTKLLDGWLGRYWASKLPNFPLEIPADPLMICLGGTVPLAFKSAKGDMGIALIDPDQFYKQGVGLTPKEDAFPAPEVNYYQKEFNFIRIIAQQSEQYSKAVKAAYDNGKNKIQVNYSSGLSQSFRLISSLIAGGLKTKVYYVNMSNFDSHAQQMQADYKGAHATLLASLANAISEFLDDAVRQGFHHRIAGMTFSEFGRRAHDNGSRGTDHGAGSMLFVFGGSADYVAGGLHREGKHPDLYDLDINGNIKHDYDYRRIYSDFLASWFNAELTDIKGLFGEDFLPLGTLKKRTDSVSSDYLKNVGGKTLFISPNPSRGAINIKFELKRATNLNLSVYSLDGRKLFDLKSGYFLPGIYDASAFINMHGTYVAVLSADNRIYTEKFIIGG